jgi:hypothetical protein
MTKRGKQLHAIADQQITELADLIRTLDEAALRLPCKGREKLGDGTVGAFVQHTADNYRRIGAFAAASDRMSAGHLTGQPGGHRSPRFLGGLGHQTARHSQNGPDSHRRDEPYTAENTSRSDLIEQLSAARKSLSGIAELTDRQLDTVPPKDSFRFCDGQRTLDQVLTALLKHQDHQVRALQAARSPIQ